MSEPVIIGRNLSQTTTTCHKLPQPLINYHNLSQPYRSNSMPCTIANCHNISLPATACNSMAQPVTVCNSMSQLGTVCHNPSQPVTSCNGLSLQAVMTHHVTTITACQQIKACHNMLQPTTACHTKSHLAAICHSLSQYMSQRVIAWVLHVVTYRSKVMAWFSAVTTPRFHNINSQEVVQ